MLARRRRPFPVHASVDQSEGPFPMTPDTVNALGYDTVKVPRSKAVVFRECDNTRR